MKTFIEVLTHEIGCAISDKLEVLADFGQVVVPMEDDGRTIYVSNEKELKISDATKYVAFHMIGDVRPNNNLNKFSALGGSNMGFDVTAVFLLFGWIDTASEKLWETMSLFNDKEYYHKSGVSTLANANVQFLNMHYNPVALVKKYFDGDFPKLQHKQSRIKAMEITYRMNISTCNYCFE